MSVTLKNWRLKKEAERRFKTGHPWVFSNELQESPKGIVPGAPIELQSSSGDFLAYGYGNPNSLIAFRVLSRFRDSQIDVFSSSFIVHQLGKAADLRKKSGRFSKSHRLCFSEADALPGLIIDCFYVGESHRLDQQQALIFSIQVLTAGMSRMIENMEDLLNQFFDSQSEWKAAGYRWEDVAIVLKNDTQARAREGLPVEEPAVLKTSRTVSLEEPVSILLPSIDRDSSMSLRADLLGGQKTGFFLDQVENIQMLKPFLPKQEQRSLKVLDLFTYVGQWSSQIGSYVPASAWIVDSSGDALRLAERNAKKYCTSVQPLKADIMRGLSGLSEKSFDVVICDPPAFIKAKKDHGPGKKAYIKVNAAAMAALSPGGVFLSSSCSHHLSEEDFREVLLQASRVSKKQIRWVKRGGHSSDHPVLMEFPEGQYLKTWIGICSS